jgi:hypothetical protein
MPKLPVNFNVLMYRLYVLPLITKLIITAALHTAGEKPVSNA